MFSEEIKGMQQRYGAFFADEEKAHISIEETVDGPVLKFGDACTLDEEIRREARIYFKMIKDMIPL